MQTTTHKRIEFQGGQLVKGNIIKMVLEVCFKHIVPMNSQSPFSNHTFQRFGCSRLSVTVNEITSHDDLLISSGSFSQ